jgi:predicted small lipoprotein YifL
MQTVKTNLLIFICVALLGACGLKGPLYLPSESPVAEPAVEQEAEQDNSEQDKDETENKKDSNENKSDNS